MGESLSPLVNDLNAGAEHHQCIMHCLQWMSMCMYMQAGPSRYVLHSPGSKARRI